MAASLLISCSGWRRPGALTIDGVLGAVRRCAAQRRDGGERMAAAAGNGAAHRRRARRQRRHFQSLTRNPLGSPDVMGFTGARSGVLVAMVLFGQNLTAIARRRWPAGADLAGGLAAGRRNGIETFRLIIIGIGVRAMLVAFNTAAARLAGDRPSAGLWNAGSQRPDTGKTAVGAADPVDAGGQRPAGSPDAAAGDGRRYRLRAGVQVERSRLLLMLVAVVLTAASTALAGPISFIALVAPHRPPPERHGPLD